MIALLLAGALLGAPESPADSGSYSDTAFTQWPSRELPDLAWREYFLVLSTGRAPYRPLYAEADAAFARAESSVFQAMSEFLDPESTREWMALQRAAGAAGHEAARGIEQALSRAATDTARWPLILALGSTGDTGSIGTIAAQSRSLDRRVRMAGAIALGDLAHPDGIPALLASLGDTEAVVRRGVVDGLRRIIERNPGLDAATRDLIRAALDTARRDLDPWVRRGARSAAVDQ
jgi:HEAT repeat protein